MTSSPEVITAKITYDEGCEGIPDRICEGDNIETYGERVKDTEVPPWIKADDETREFEKIREKRLRDMRHSHVYKFVMLLSGFTNEKMEKYWTRSTGVQKTNFSTDSPFDVTNSMPSTTDNKVSEQIKYHDWYINTTWADGLVYLTPMVYAHMEEAFTAITQRHDHLKDIKLWQFIESPRIRSLFARMVAMCIRVSSALSGHKYHLNNTYKRVNLERMRLMNVFRHVRLQDRVIKHPVTGEMQPGLVYKKVDANPHYAGLTSGKDNIYDRLAMANQLTKMNRTKMFLN